VSSLSTRARARLSSFALALVILCVVTGAYGVDRALVDSVAAKSEVDAQKSAKVVENFVALRSEALSALQGLFADSTSGPVEPSDVTRLVALLGSHLNGFRSVWATDSAGAPIHAVGLRRGDSASFELPREMGLAPILARARAARTAEVSGLVPVTATERGIVIVHPVFLGPRLAGFVAGSIDSTALARSVQPEPEDQRRRMTLQIGDRNVIDAPPIAVDSGAFGEAEARLPGGGRWQVQVVHAPPDVTLRVVIWVIALGALTVLTVTLVYERDQAKRIEERSRELERLSSELLRANRAKSEFLANVSHELRTPLNAIVGFADLLRDGVYGELAARQVGPVERIEASANHLRHLVDQILDLAKMAAGRLEVHPELLDLRPFVFDVASEMESLVTEKGLTLSLGVGSTIPRVRTDPGHLRQILVNLLGNAVKFTPQGTVSVRARLVGPNIGGASDGNGSGPSIPGDAAPAAEFLGDPDRRDATWVALQVVDTGVGIPIQDRERIFDEFEQVNPGPRGDSMRRGTGLGLSISRRLARLLGGDITLESELGRGSTFTLWLPVDEADLSETGERRAPRLAAFPPIST
jgi:signal transduction histidine kinase